MALTTAPVPQRTGKPHWIVLLAVASGPANAAGGSYLVDDAAATPAGACQVESWARAFRGGTEELTLTPACNRLGIEWSAGFTLLSGGDALDAVTLGAKWLWRDFDAFPVGAGLAAGTIVTGHGIAQTYAYVPASFALTASRTVMVHANAGVRRLGGGSTDAVGGLAFEVALGEQARLIVERFQVSGAEASDQAGVRVGIRDGVDIDLVAGRVHDATDAEWVTLGLNLAL